MPIPSVFHEDQKFFKSDTIFVTFKSVTFEILGKCLESFNYNTNNDLQEDLKIFKSDTVISKRSRTWNASIYFFYTDSSRY